MEDKPKVKTHTPKEAEIKGKWYLLDANGEILGRLASTAASILRGKHRPDFTPFLNLEDHVVVVNAAKIAVTGKKLDDKVYYWHSGYPGGIKSIILRDLLAKKPEDVIRKAVTGMLPHNRLGRALAKKLRIYAGPDHPHVAQSPEKISVY